LQAHCDENVPQAVDGLLVVELRVKSIGNRDGCAVNCSISVARSQLATTQSSSSIDDVGGIIVSSITTILQRRC